MMRTLNGKLYEVCGGCGDIIRLDKPLFGSVHVCATAEEQRKYAAQIAAKFAVNKARLENAK